MARHWTPEERKRHAELIKRWQPWKKAGVKTQQGKEKSKMNALKHGVYSEETQAMKRLLMLCRKQLEVLARGWGRGR